MNVPVLSAFYFGSVEHYRVLASHPRVIIDVGEHYVRQSYRTRTSIVGPNGVQHLTVQVEHDHGHKMPMREVRISYAETWPQQHVHALRSAYGKAPWTLHFMDAMEEVLLQRHARLVDLDLATMRLCMKWLGLNTEVEVSGTYVEVARDERRAASVPDATRHSPLTDHYSDLRTSLHPKRPLPPGLETLPEYHQVFADRHGYQVRMSIIDLLCNCGPQAAALLR